jgi:hypothetical protein
MWRTLFFDRRFALLALIVLLAWIVGRYTLSDGQALNAVIHGGYWVTLAAFGVWLWAMERLRRAEGWHLPQDAGGWVVVALVIAGGLLWQAHEEHGYKILADESLLVGTAQNLHLDRQVGYGVRGTDVQGHFQVLQSVLDKRPFFHPFLVSLVHDLTGYRVENAFWVNTVLGFVFLALLYGLAARAGRGRAAGTFALLAAIGLPLLAQQSAGAGFELLNLCLIAGWWWLAIHMLSRPDDVRQNAFVLTSVLLASTRYESLLFLAPTALLLLVAWRRVGCVRFTWPTFVAPLFVIPMLWLNRSFSANAELWQTASREATAPFSLDYVAGNLGHALQFLFSLDGYHPNSPFLSLCGLLALPLFLLWAQRIWRAPISSSGEEVGVALGALGPLISLVLLMVYFWGQLDDPVISRLGLPLHLLLLIAVAVAVGRVIPKGERAWAWLSGAAIVALLVFGLPMMARNAYGHAYSPGIAYAWRREFLAARPERDFLVIDRDNTFWITERVSSTPVNQARLRRDGIAFHLRNRSFAAAYVYQSFLIDPDTGGLDLDPADDVGSDFVLETVAERKTAMLQLGRFSRVVAVRDGERELAHAHDVPVIFKSELKPGEAEAAKARYLERWVKELP